MNSGHEINGIWSPCLTPVTSKFTIDDARLFEHVDWLFGSGCHGVTLFGTTSEAPSFSISQRIETLEYLVRSGIDPETLMIGNGFTAGDDTHTVTRHALEIGCRYVLTVPPFYFKNLSDDGVVDSYRRMLDQLNSSDIRVIVYHFPQLSAVPITLEVIEKLLESHGNLIAGVKDSSGSWESVKAFIESFPALAIFPGSDNLLLDALRTGGAGTISATVNINPDGIRKIYDLWQADDNESAAAQKNAKLIRDLIFSYPSIAALKAVHAVAKDDPEWNRVCPPLVTLSENDRTRLMNALAETELDLKRLKN